MSAYPPPIQYIPIFNSSEFSYSSSGLTITTGDARYLKLTGGIESGLVTFNSGIQTANIYNSGNTFSVPSSSGQLALVSQIPTSSSFVDLTTNQSIAGIKTFSTNPVISAIANGSFNFTIPTLFTADTALGINTFQNAQNKTISYSSNSSIASFTASVITTPYAHGLATGDVIVFPSVGSMTGISANTGYTVSSTPLATTFTLSGISSLAGTVGTAFYTLVTRNSNNYATAGGMFTLSDANNNTCPLRFDIAAATQPVVLRFPLTSAVPITFPAAGGVLMTTTATQNISGNTTFSGQLTSSRLGNSSAASAPVYINPASTTMSGANNYYWTYLNTPVTTGSTSGTAATLTIAGGPTVAAGGGNYALQILASQSSIPAGTVGAPSLVFGAANTSGLYSSTSNVINMAISGILITTVNSTGLTVAGLVSGTTHTSGAGSVGAPSYYLSGDTTTGWYRPSAGQWTWVGAGNSVLNLTSTGITITGTTSLGAQTIIPSSSNTIPAILMNAASLYSDVSGSWKFQSGANLRLTLDNTGATVSGTLNANGNTYCNSSTNYMLTRSYKNSVTASTGVVAMQLQTNLGGTTFGVDNGGVYLVTMTLQSGDFGTAHGLWHGIIELSTFAGGKSTANTIAAVNASLTSISTAGLLTITVSQSTSSIYEFTQMQICY